MRQYMRARRGSVLTTEPARPRQEAAWLPKLRRLYRDLLRAQSSLAAFRTDATRAGQAADPPPHLIEAEARAGERLDAHAALKPDLAAEYFARHEAAHLLKEANRLERTLHALPRSAGRPAKPLAHYQAAEADARAARAARAAAYAAYQAALATDAALDPHEATRVQTAWTRAAAAHERAAGDLEAARTRAELHEARAGALDAQRRDSHAALSVLRDQAAALLAPYPVVRAPLHPPRTNEADAQRAARRGARDPRPLRDAHLPALRDIFGTRTDPTTGATVLVRHRSPGRAVRAPVVRATGTPWVRTADLLDALAPCGLV